MFSSLPVSHSVSSVDPFADPSSVLYYLFPELVHLFFFHILFLFGEGAGVTTRVEVRRQPAGIGSSLPSRGSQGWAARALPTEQLTSCTHSLLCITTPASLLCHRHTDNPQFFSVGCDHENSHFGAAGKMVQGLRVLSAVVEDPRSVLSQVARHLKTKKIKSWTR